MAWSPVRRVNAGLVRVEAPGDYATPNSNQLRDGTSVGLHKLKGNRRNQWAMTVNARWCVCFEFRDGDAFEVEIVDYHKG
jgi:plasmid maintenance system killer protein